METCGHSDSSCGKLSKGENNNDNNKLFTDINITLYILSYNLVKEVCSACLQGNYFGIKINLMYHVFFPNILEFKNPVQKTRFSFKR